MNVSFLSPKLGRCLLRLWASGRYGFSLPKKVEITTGTGETSVFLYYNRRLGLQTEWSNRELIRIAIAQFLEGERERGAVAEINDEVIPFAGTITQLQASPPPAPPRLRSGRSGAKTPSGKASRMSRPE